MPASAIQPVPLALFDDDPNAFAQALGGSFERYGFAVLGGHGLDKAMLSDALSATKAFFALPEGIKRAYHIEGGKGQRGYTAFGVETAKDHVHHDLKEFWHVGRDLPEGHPYRSFMADNIWPSEVPEFQAATQALFDSLDAMGRRVLRAIALYLDQPEDLFDAAVKDGNSILRLLHYPPVENEGGSVRAGAHGDINAITLLLGAEEPGLEILDRDGQWLPITPPENCIVCNIGDMLSRMTNHRLPSTIHRVVNPAEGRRGVSRYSTPFFMHFEGPYVIRTLTNCIDADHSDQYADKDITAHEFLQQRLREIKLA